MKKLNLLEVLEGIEDGRRERSVWYPLHEALFIMLVAVICGATSYVKEDIGWLEGREKWPGLHGIGVIFCHIVCSLVQ